MYRLRIKIFLAIIGLVFVGMAARLWYLQVVQGDYYRSLARLSLEHVDPLHASRGTIYDRNRKILAMDEPCHDFCLEYGFLAQDARWVRRQKSLIALRMNVGRNEAEEIYNRRAENTRRLAERLAGESGVDLTAARERIIHRVARLRQIVNMDVREQRQAHPIVRGLDDAATLTLKEQLDETIGASVVQSHRRSYPFGSLACHIIGVTGQVSEEEQDHHNLTKDQSDELTRMLQNYQDGEIIGKSGAERLFEGTLRGQRGYQRIRQPGEILESVPAVAGRDIHLTIDIEFQAKLRELLTSGGHTGCVVVLSVPKGEVLAMVSVPDYDLNTYRREYNRLLQDTVDVPMLHRAVARCYPPGSTMKAIAALSALGAGAITESTGLDCPGFLRESDREHFRCWNRSGHGELSVTQALKQSCNVFFYKVGDRLGASGMAEWASLFGFGELPGTGLPEEVCGTLPTADFIRRRYDRRTEPADAWLTAIGQGPVTATPLQVANAMATIAKDGVFDSPTIVAEGGPDRNHRKLKLSASNLQAVKDGMYGVVNEPGGTAYKTFSELGPLEDKVCGKTGTAQTPPIWRDLNGNGRQDPEEIIRSGSTAWFAGFAPYHNSRIAFAVVVEYVTTGGGGQNAGPIAHSLVRICREMGYMQ